MTPEADAVYRRCTDPDDADEIRGVAGKPCVVAGSCFAAAGR